MHGRGDFAAVVQQAGDAQLVAVALSHSETAERAHRCFGHRIRQHHGEFGNAVAMAAGIVRFVVDGGVDQADERLKQIFKMVNQQPIGECYRRLRRQ